MSVSNSGIQFAITGNDGEFVPREILEESDEADCPLENAQKKYVQKNSQVKNRNRLDSVASGQYTVKTLSQVQPVAWMVIFGDGIHNFVDGLSIGAGLSRSFPEGLSIAMAVLAEELPHELGDLAVLLRAGLSIKQALLFNFMSACLCYVGFVIGALVGEFPRAK